MRVTEFPLQTVVDDAVMLAVGAVVTFTSMLAVSEHPLELVTVTAYPVCTKGVTISGFMVEPVLHEYPFPPEAVSVALPPLQIVTGSGLATPLMFATGGLLTVTVAIKPFVHPFPSVPITV